jgi:hypothetical protein
MRVDVPILSMAATRRKAERRCGASVPKARHAPLNSSIRGIQTQDLGCDLEGV